MKHLVCIVLSLLLTVLSAHAAAQEPTRAEPLSWKEIARETPLFSLYDPYGPSLESLEQAAAKGNIAARHQAAVKLLRGDGVCAPLDKAALILQETAEAGYPASQYLLGMMLLEGYQVMQHTEKGVEFLEKAASQGELRALAVLGERFFFLPPSRKEERATALAFLFQAAEKKERRGLRLLGELYLHGNGVPQDILKAKELLLTSAELGDADAQNELAWIYFTGKQGILPIDPKQSYALMRLSAMQNFSLAQAGMGYRFSEGLDVPKDMEKAFAWHLKAAEQGNPGSQYFVARAYNLGLGVEKDTTRMLHWLLSAASEGYPAAQATLGRYYLQGTGVAKNEAEGAFWLEKARENGHPDEDPAFETSTNNL